MRLAYLILPCLLAAGCGPGEQKFTPQPGASTSAEEQLQKIQNDPNKPEGLKRIQAESLSRQPGVKR